MSGHNEVLRGYNSLLGIPYLRLMRRELWASSIFQLVRGFMFNRSFVMKISVQWIFGIISSRRFEASVSTKVRVSD